MLPRVPFNFFTYFEDIAKKHVDIAHIDNTAGNKALFIVPSINDAFEFISNSTQPLPETTALLIQEGYEGNVLETNSNNEIDRQFYQFWVIQHSPGDDANARRAVFNNCKAIYRQIKARMRIDKVNNVKGLYFLDINSFTYTQVPPIADNYMGIAVTFMVAEPDGSTIDPNKWLP